MYMAPSQDVLLCRCKLCMYTKKSIITMIRTVALGSKLVDGNTDKHWRTLQFHQHQ